MDKHIPPEHNSERVLGEKLFRRILQALPDTTLIISERGVVIDCIKSLPLDDVTPSRIEAGSPIGDVFGKTIAIELDGMLQTGSSHGTDASKEICLDADRHLYVELQLIPLDNKQYLMIVRNISGRWQAQAAIEKSESFYRTIFETTGAASVIFQRDTAIIDANLQFSQLSGYSTEEFADV